ELLFEIDELKRQLHEARVHFLFIKIFWHFVLEWKRTISHFITLAHSHLPILAQGPRRTNSHSNLNGATESFSMVNFIPCCFTNLCPFHLLLLKYFYIFFFNVSIFL